MFLNALGSKYAPKARKTCVSSYKMNSMSSK